MAYRAGAHVWHTDDSTAQLVEPINQTAEVDSLVPGLCAFLLGLCYEFNREPGEITR